jgi:predicted RNA-binding protein with PIN domain
LCHGYTEMPYLIDGNNLIAASMNLGEQSSALRRRLIHDLVGFVAVKRARITLFFDGKPEEDFPDGIKFKGVKILYARYGSNADERILEVLKKSSGKRDAIVVSSDRLLAELASSQKAKVLSSQQFRKILDSCEKESTGLREKAVDSQDIDYWMQYFDKNEHER